MNWQGKMDAYLDDLNRGREAESLRNYRVRLNRFVGWMSRRRSKKLDADVYEEWLVWAGGRWKNSTVYATHKTTRRFLAHIDHPALKEILLIRFKQRLPPIKTYTPDQLQVLTDWCLDQQRHTNWRRRCSMYILILMTSGMRANEARLLKWENQDISSHSFFLESTKTGHTRIAAYEPELTPLLEEYRKDMEASNGGPSPWVFPSMLGRLNPAPYNAIATKMNNVVSKEVGFKINRKMFRSTMVQRMMDSGSRYEEAAAVVGHRDIGVTQRYYSRIKLGVRAMNARSKAMQGLNFTYIQVDGPATIEGEETNGGERAMAENQHLRPGLR